MKKILYIFIIGFIVITISSCNVDRKELPKFGNFQDSIGSFFIKFDTLSFINTSCNVQIRTYDGEFSGYLCGHLSYNNNTFYVKLLEPHSNEKFILFDFNLQKNESRTITWKISKIKYKRDSILNRKTYKLIAEDVFWDNNYNDTIFKFVFSGYKLTYLHDDACLFVGKTAGIVGVYYSFFEENDDTEYIYLHNGNIYRDSLNYSNANFDVIFE